MFIVLLKFSENRQLAAQHVEAHKAWIQRGFEDGVFLVVGSLQPNLGGSVLAHRVSLMDLQDRVKQDPFVIEGIVSAEVLELTPSRTDERLRFLMD